jgi:aspartyl-tRNA(Asn)/glutamyl-tRNA(Gln) amidotransferase subunit A
VTLARSLAGLARALRDGEVSADELAEAAIAAHDARGDGLCAYAEFDADGARAAARDADARLATDMDPPPLCGIPISVKDIYGVTGLPTFAGTRKRLPQRWERDGWLVGRLREQGAVIVGKSHTVEMAFAGVGMNPNWSTPRNPWDPDVARIPGGSSSGAGVSLHEASAVIALGSDTGGSIRIPATFTGTVGHKTTKGRWPTTGVVPLSHTFDTVGALTRTVADSVYFFGAVDPDHGDPRELHLELDTRSPSSLRIGVPVCEIHKECQADVGDVISRALLDLSTAGVRLSESDGHLLDEAAALYLAGGIGGTECRHFLEQELPGWLELLHPIVGSRLGSATSPHDPRYQRAIAEHRRMAAEAEALFDGVDVLALPTNLITPPPLSEVSGPERLERYLAVNAATLRPTCPVNLLGLCAVTVPVGLDRARMPVGLQLVAPAGSDADVLAAALTIERVLGTARDRIGQAPMAG